MAARQPQPDPQQISNQGNIDVPPLPPSLVDDNSLLQQILRNNPQLTEQQALEMLRNMGAL